MDDVDTGLLLQQMTGVHVVKVDVLKKAAICHHTVVV
jgi:hypothetical protein